jgi:hypothetical protein
MTTPELLSKVGFEKGKIGSGEKESGYQIKESSLGSLLGSAFVCFAVMGLMVVSMVFDVHFEKKTLHRQLRAEEHHAVAKLAQVQMELWSQYHDDIKESHEAHKLLIDLNTSMTLLQGKLKGAIDEQAAELSLNPVKAAKFADKILHIVAASQQDNLKHTKHLLDHLINVGKKSAKLEKFVDKEIHHEVIEEHKKEVEDKKEGIDVGVHEPHHVPDAKHPAHHADAKDKPKNPEDPPEDEDPLKDMLEGFFKTLGDFQKEFPKEVRAKLKDGNPAYEQIKDLYGKIKAEDNNLGEEEVNNELNKIDLASVGAALGSGRVLPVNDVVEELAMVPKVPVKKLEKLEAEWRKGKGDTMDIFEQLNELHEKGVIPGGWLQMGVDKMEKEEEMEEEKLENHEA